MRPATALALALVILVASAFAERESPACPARPNAQPSLSIGSVSIGPQTFSEPELGAAALDQAIRDLKNPYHVMFVSAQPGDEDSSALVYARKKMGARTLVLFANRGENRQQDLGAGSREEAALIGTEQALAVADDEGADAEFLDLPDFNGSQAQALAGAWRLNGARAKFVRAIRRFRPDVVIYDAPRSDSVPGYNWLESMLIWSMDAAADRARVPEAGPAWRASRLFLSADDPSSIEIASTDETDPVRGLTYTEIGRRARAGYAHSLSASKFRYRLEWPSLRAGDQPPSSILDGLKLAGPITQALTFPDLDPGGLAYSSYSSELAKLIVRKMLFLGSTQDAEGEYGPDYFRIVEFTEKLNRAAGLAMGLSLTVNPSRPVVNPGKELAATVTLVNHGPNPLPVEFLSPAVFPSGSSEPVKKDLTSVGAGQPIQIDLRYTVPNDEPLTLPASAHIYDRFYYPVGSHAGERLPIPPVAVSLPVEARLDIGPMVISLTAVGLFDVAQPFELAVTPPVAFVADPSVPRPVDFTARVINHTGGPCSADLWVVPLALVDEKYEPVHLTFDRSEQERRVMFRVGVPVLKPPLAPDMLVELRAAGLDPQPGSLASFKIQVRRADFALDPSLDIGYIPDGGNWLQEALCEFGARHEDLTPANLNFAEAKDLGRFSAIVVAGPTGRSEAEQAWVNRLLLQYAELGGILVLLPAYDFKALGEDSGQDEARNLKTGDSGGRAQMPAPYPISLGGPEVPPMAMLTRIDDPVLSAPNTIAQSDFAAWPGDRAIRTIVKWDDRYQPLITYDPGAGEPRSVLVGARIGWGRVFVSTLDWPSAVSRNHLGAYKLLADLVTAGRPRKPPSM